MNGWGCRWVWFGMKTSIDGWSVCGAGRLTCKVEKRLPKKKEACQKDNVPHGAALVVEQSHVFLAPTPWTQQWCERSQSNMKWGWQGCVDSVSLQLSYPKSQWNPGAACFRPAQALKLERMPLLRSASGRARWRKAWWLRRARTPKIDHDVPGIPWGCVTWWIIPWTWAYIVQWWIAEAHSTIWTGNVFQTVLDYVGPFLVSMSGIVSLQAWFKSTLIHL